jgi:HK97 family phage prohead protease
MEQKSFALGEFKALGDSDEAGTFEAVVAAFDNIDAGGDRVRPGAFKRSLAEWKANNRSIPVLWSHNSEMPPIGVIQEAKETLEGLRVKARLFVDDHPSAKAVYAAMKGGALHEFSFGYGVPKGGAKKTFEGGKQIRDLLDLDLGEVSPVFRGMNPATRLIGAKSLNEDLETRENQRDDLERKIAEAKTALKELPEETADAEHEDNPEPNSTQVDEEAKARIRALQISQPQHLESLNG